mgnify:CR=1 FL=1|tara:strand:- start:2991 stop:3371 length:381 start_codon:yes stop_codon:yes gene_type:complete
MTQLFLDNNKLNCDLEEYYKEDIENINIAQKNLLEYIESQDEKIDNIEQSMDTIKYNTQFGLDNLIEANNYNISYKGVMVGGIIGGLFLSPFGFLLGIKTGAIIGMSGMLMGSVACYKLQEIEPQK